MNDVYRLEKNGCNCNPETCNCNDWAIYTGKTKHSTYFDRKVAEEVCDALNFKRLAVILMNNY